MIRLQDSRVVFLLLALALVGACHAKRSPTIARQSPLTPVAQEIERRGYHAKESLIVPPTPWEISLFRMRYKRSFSFRANQAEAGTRNYFVRFWLFEETYDSIEDARHRLANLHAPEPGTNSAVMRTGFRVGSVVYIMKNDAIIFWDETRRFAKELADATQGVELTL